MSTKLKLTITEGTKKGEEFVFEEHDTFLFGRMDDCHACLPDDQFVSRHHFILEVNPPDARLRDLGSKNGTHVNGKKYGGREKDETPEEGARRQYPEVDLHDDDEIKVGDTVLRVAVETPPPPPEPVRCQRCGKDVSAEAGPGHQGDYMCQSCQRVVEADVADMLAELLAKARKQTPGEFSLPDYDVEQELGEGGMGKVYLARHKAKGHRVALKVMLSKVAVSEGARKRFLREIETTRALRHKHIVEFLDHGSAGGVFYFLLEFCEGGSVDKLMARRGGRLLLDEAGPIMVQALDGLAFAHEKGFVHRDLKPQNLLLTGADQRWTAKVADMGLAKSFTQAGFSGLTATGSYAGSFPFMPREQVTNFKFVKPVSDVWSMGATFYNMLTGQWPRDFRRGQDPVEAILHGEIVPIRKRDSRIPARMAEVIDRSLASKPADRYQSAGEMRQALEKAL